MRTITPMARTERTRKSYKMREASNRAFLNKLVALASPSEKRELIKQHNPFFYTFFGG